MKDLAKRIKEKTKELETLGREIVQFQQVLKDKQIQALRVDGALTVLKELNQKTSKVMPKKVVQKDS